jgi:hypothetical protein
MPSLIKLRSIVGIVRQLGQTVRLTCYEALVLCQTTDLPAASGTAGKRCQIFPGVRGADMPE